MYIFELYYIQNYRLLPNCDHREKVGMRVDAVIMDL